MHLAFLGLADHRERTTINIWNTVMVSRRFRVLVPHVLYVGTGRAMLYPELDDKLQDHQDVCSF